MTWQSIKDNQKEKRFYQNDLPIFKQYKNILKFHAPGLAPVEDETGWYHIDENGNEIYSERYKRAFGFYCDRAAVTSLDKECFHINTKGKRAYAETYAWVGNFQENLCTIRKFDFNSNRNVYFHIGINGEKIYSETFLYAGDFRDGIAVVRDINNGLCHHIDNHGNRINNKDFIDLDVFHKNIAPAKDLLGWFHSDINGDPLYTQRFLSIEPFYNGFALVETLDNKKKIINEQGNTVVLL